MHTQSGEGFYPGLPGPEPFLPEVCQHMGAGYLSYSLSLAFFDCIIKNAASSTQFSAFFLQLHTSSCPPVISGTPSHLGRWIFPSSFGQHQIFGKGEYIRIVMIAKFTFLPARIERNSVLTFHSRIIIQE